MGRCRGGCSRDPSFRPGRRRLSPGRSGFRSGLTGDMADDLPSAAGSISSGMRGSAAGATPRRQAGFSLFLLLIAVTALNSVAVNLLVPVLPHIAKELGSDYATIQL